MEFQKGNIVLIPFPYTDLSANKTRPAIIVSSKKYHDICSDLLLAYISSQLTKTNSILDYVLLDWEMAGLPKPSFVRPKLATIDRSLIVHLVGKLSDRDLLEVDRRLRLAMALTDTALIDVLEEVDLMVQPSEILQRLAEKSTSAVKSLALANTTGIDIERLRQILLE